MAAAQINTNVTYMLSDLIGGKARNAGKTIGRLADIVITDAEKVPEVTHLLIERPYGYKSLMVPWVNVEQLDPNGRVLLKLEALEGFEGVPGEGQVCLRDHLLDKKVLDCDDDEVEVVYDIKLVARNGRLYVTDVDCSRAGFFRRIGLRRLSDFIRGLAAKINDDTIPWSYVQPLPHDIGSFGGNVRLNVLKTKLPDINPVDLADILEEIDHEQRMAIFNQLDTEQASDTLEEIEPRVQRELVSSLTVERAAELVGDMTPAQAADVLGVLPSQEVEEILEHVDKEDATKIHALIDKHDGRILDMATEHTISFGPRVSVGEVLVRYREVAKDADVVMYVYIVDGNGALLGVLDIKELVQADLSQILEDIMVTNIVSLDETSTVADAAEMFKRYSFRAIPVLGEANVMRGAVLYRDIMHLHHRFV
jgi:CBS domain-containing protein